ncbi:thiol management oxidoreductase [Bacillus safensis]|uniref:globin domain-containing protein n=1 Tax=Bacillus safensis TaxID=561879 RepID=UPI0039B4AB8F
MVQSFNAPYEAVGEELLSQLVDTFYENVKCHPLLHPIFPDDLKDTARKQKQFLTQYLGGPPLYTEEHGHPMLRARHLPFPITEERADAWLECMEDAMDQVGLTGDIRDFLFERLSLTARHMVNQTPEKDGRS